MFEFIKTVLRILSRDFLEAHKDQIRYASYLAQVSFMVLLAELFLAGGLTAVGFIPITPWGFTAMFLLNIPLGFILMSEIKRLKEEMKI